MSRFLLGLCLSLCTLVALAKAPAGSEDCPAAAAKTEKSSSVSGAANSAADADAAPQTHTAVAPLHSASAPRMTSPRWHSLLPGMIR